MNIKNEFYKSSNNYEKRRMNYEKNKLHKRKDVIGYRLVAGRDYYVDESTRCTDSDGDDYYTERKNKMEERYYVKVGNCYAAFLGMWHELVMRSDYHKATPFMTEADAKNEANKRGVKTFKIVKKPFVK